MAMLDIRYQKHTQQKDQNNMAGTLDIIKQILDAEMQMHKQNKLGEQSYITEKDGGTCMTVKRFLNGLEKMRFNQAFSPIGKNCRRG